MAGAADTRQLLNDPRILAGAAAGLACAALAAWGFRGLPLGTLLFWLCSLPLFLAGLSLGGFAAGLGLAVASAALLLVAGLRGVLVFALATGLPAVTIVAAFLNRGRGDLTLPFALLGIWPAVASAASLLLGPDGLEAALAASVAEALSGSGVAADPGLVAGLVRVGMAMAGATLSLPLLVCGVAAQRWLVRRGLALRPSPAWRDARLPRFYLALPVLAALLAWVVPEGDTGLLLLTVTAALLMPVFLQGLAAIHRRLRGAPLVLFYVCLVVFFLPVLALVVGLGLFEQFGRKPTKPEGQPR